MNNAMWNKCQCTRVILPESPLMKKYLMVEIYIRKGYTSRSWVEMDIALITMDRLPPTIGSLIGRNATYLATCIYRVSDGVAMMWDKEFFNASYPFINPMHRITNGR